MISESSKNKVFIIVILVFLAICLFLYFARSILAPFIIAALITYLLSPLVLKIQAYGYRRWIAVAIIAIAFIIVLAGILIVFIPMLSDEIEKLRLNYSSYYNYVYNHILVAKEKIEITFPSIKEYHISEIAIEKVRAIIISEGQKVPSYILSFFSTFSVMILIPMLVFFMLLGGNRTVKAIVELIPSTYVETLLSILYEMDSILGRFIRGQLIEALFVGTMSVIVLNIFDVNFALLIGVAAGCANMIPYLGPFVGLIIASIVGLVQFQSAYILLKIIPAFLIIQFLDNNIVQPLVVGYNVNLSPATMVFAMLAGAQVFGFLGIIFAVPVMAIIKTISIMLVKKYKNLLSE